MAELKPTIITTVELTAKEYAAIHLCVPDSGNDDLDAMIRRAQRERLAGKIMAAMYSADNPTDEINAEIRADYCYGVADAVIAAGGGK
jgi:hypothetical protein